MLAPTMPATRTTHYDAHGVILPAMASADDDWHGAPGPRDHALAATAGCLAGVKVLLAEDGIDNQRLVQAVLGRSGVELVIVSNGRDAVNAVLQAEQGRQPFDVVLMDMRMPVMDGFAATTALRQTGWKQPIIAFTARSYGDEDKCLAAGCDRVLHKPYRFEELIQALRPQ